MAKIQRSTVVNAPVEKCFDFIADPEKAPIFVSSLHSVTPVVVEPKGKGNAWKWEYDLFGMPFQGESECIGYDRPSRYVWKSVTGIRSTWTYTFAPKDGGTMLSLEVDYEIPQNLAGAAIKDAGIIEKLNENEADNAFKNLKTVLET